APVLAQIARTGEALGVFRLEDGRRQQVAEVSISAHSPLAGQRIKDAAAHHQVLAVAHFSSAGKRFLDEVDSETRLVPGDRLVVCAEPARLTTLLAGAGEESLPELIWAGLLRRLGRMFWRTLGEIDLPVKICTSVLLAVIFISVVVFHVGMKNDTLVDA